VHVLARFRRDDLSLGRAVSNSLDRCYGFCVPEPAGICGAGVVDGGAVATGLVELSGLFAMPAPVVVDVVPVFEAVDMPLFDNP